jgi:hypothetical protein
MAGLVKGRLFPLPNEGYTPIFYSWILLPPPVTPELLIS